VHRMKLLTSNVVIIVPHRQFNDDEFSIVNARLESEGCRIKIAAASLQAAVGSNGALLKPQLLLSDVQTSKFHAAIFVGGKGSRDYWDHPRAHNLVRNFDTNGKLLAAICIAPVIFSKSGILKGREGACHPSVKKDFEAGGAIFRSDPVVVSSRIVTAPGPDEATVFVERIIDLLS
jgi:deglycase